MINFLNQSHYNYLLIGILGLLVGWLISKLLVNKYWKKRYQQLENENESYLTLLDESDTHNRSYDKVVKKLSSQFALLNSDNRTLVKAFSKLQAHRDTLESRLDTSAGLLKEAKQDNITLKYKNSSLVDKLDIAVKEQKSFKALEDSTTELQQKLTSTENKNKETESILENLKATHNELWQEYRLLQEDMSSQSTARSETESQERKQLEKLSAKIDEISSERDQLIVNAEKHIVQTTEIKKIKEKASELEKEKKQLNATILQQQQALETFTDIQTKLQMLEDQNSTLNTKLDIEKHNSTAILGQHSMLQNSLLENESKLKESNNQEKKATQEEIKRHEDYLLKSETRWASELNTLNIKLKSERNNHSMLLQKANDETQSTRTKLVAITAKLEKAEAKLLKINPDHSHREKIKNEAIKTEETGLEKKTKPPSKGFTKGSNSSPSKSPSKHTQIDTPQADFAVTVQPSRVSKPKAGGKFESKSELNTRSELTNNTSKSATTNKTVNNKAIKARLPIDAIKGIGVVYAKRLKNIKVDYVDILFSKGHTVAGRKSLSTRTDIDEKLIQTWVGQADLLRVEGINADHAELLETAGINNTTALRNSNPSSLSKKLIALNKDNEICSKTPTKQIVTIWAANAEKVSKVVDYETVPKNRSTLNAKANKKHSENRDTKPDTKPDTRPDTKRGKKSSNTFNNVDELTKIKGIGKVNEKLLHSLGIKTFAQIAKFTKQDEIEVGEKLSSFHNRIAKENWVHQATELLKKN